MSNEQLAFFQNLQDLSEKSSRETPYLLEPHWVSYHLNTWIFLYEDKIMPRKPKSSSFGNKMPEFVDLVLTREDKDFFSQWVVKNSGNFENELLDYVGMDIRVGFSFDLQNDCYICSFTPRGETDVNTGRCLVSRAPEPYTAFLVNRFKHETIFHSAEWHTEFDNSDIS